MKIIEERYTEETVRHSLNYDRLGEPHCGFSFDCDEKGVIDEEKLHETARTKSLPYCKENVGTVFEEPYIHTWTERYTHPAVGLCDCGAKVYLDSFTNTCPKCKADYNSSGDKLVARCLWDGTDGAYSPDYE